MSDGVYKKTSAWVIEHPDRRGSADIISDLRSQLAAASAERDKLDEANVDLAHEAMIARQLLKEGFEKYAYEEMECRGDEDCDHCYLVKTLEADKKSLKALEDEHVYLAAENEKLKAEVENEREKSTQLKIGIDKATDIIQALRSLMEKASELFEQIPYASREGEYRKQWQAAKKETGIE